MLVTLFDETTGELWVANLGDSCAGTPSTHRSPLGLHSNTRSRGTQSWGADKTAAGPASW